MANWHILLENGRPVRAFETARSGEIVKDAGAVWPLRELCARAGKSRRQIYRDIRSGKIRPLGKFLGEWLVEPSQLLKLNPPPASFASLFPEHEAGKLDPERDRKEILSRVLRFGDRARLGWAFSLYGLDAVRRFIREDGAARLDARSLRFWRLYFGLRSAPEAAARVRGREWGGAS